MLVRTLLAAAAFSLALAALSIAAAPALASECKGLKSAHCRCRVVVGAHQASDADHKITPAGWVGKELFTYTLPNKCFNQQKDAIEFRLNKGCWKACRDAYGVEGATPDPALIELKKQAGKKLREAGYCGGWINGDTFFAAGTNKYRSNTAVGIGIGIGGSVVIKDGKKTCH
jgi:hypothetical protein